MDARDQRQNEPGDLQQVARMRAEFRWEQARRQLAGLPDGRGLNIAHEAIDRHATTERARQVAIRWLAKSGETVDFSYADMKENTDRFANVLQNLGVQKGDRVFTLLGRVPELYITALGTLKHRAVYCPLFSAFGRDPVRIRLERGDAKVLVTTELLDIRDSMDFLNFVIGVHDRLGIEIPESDYPAFRTLGGGIDYLRTHMNRTSSTN